MTFNYGCKITCLDLSSIAKDELLENLKNIPLTHLILRESTVSDTGLSKLGNLCPNLIYLDLYNCKNHSMPSLSGLLQLEYLNVSGCNNLSLEAYRPIILDLRNLRYVLCSETFFDQVSLSLLLYYCPNLKYVGSNKYIDIDPKVQEFVAQYNPNFKYSGGYYNSDPMPEEYQIKEEERQYEERNDYNYGEEDRYYSYESRHNYDNNTPSDSDSDYSVEEEKLIKICENILKMGKKWGPDMKQFAIAGLTELYEKMKERANEGILVTSSGSWNESWRLPQAGCGAALFETSADTDLYVYLSTNMHSLDESYHVFISGWGKTNFLGNFLINLGDSKTIVQCPSGGETIVEVNLFEHPEAGLKEPGWKQFWIK